jgi:hypothetical protein
MSHVDEGTLHAWLDGALDALPAAEAARVREHLATCEACAARLEEERQVRQEAADILGAAVPASIEPPAFEEVRALARARSKAAAAPSRISRLGWAASIVLALGAGWMLRGAALPDFGRAGFERDATRAEEAAADLDDSPVPSSPGAAEAAVDEAEAAPPVPSGGVAPVPVSPTRQRVDSVAFDAVTAIEAAPAEKRALPVPPPTERLLPEPVWVRDEAIPTAVVPAARFDTLAFPRTAAEAKEAVAAASTERLADAAKPDAATGRAAPLATGQDLGAVRNAVLPAAARRAAPSIVREAALDASASLVVPGLEVLSVAGLDAEGLPGGVRVRQRLVGGDTLEMVHLPAGTTPSMLEPVTADTRTELVLPRDGGWLLVRAHATREALLELVRRMDQGG